MGNLVGKIVSSRAQKWSNGLEVIYLKVSTTESDDPWVSMNPISLIVVPEDIGMNNLFKVFVQNATMQQGGKYSGAYVGNYIECQIATVQHKGLYVHYRLNCNCKNPVELLSKKPKKMFFDDSKVIKFGK